MKKRKITYFLVIVLALSLLVVGCGSSQSGTTDSAQKTIKLGLITPLTGSFAANGIDMRDGLQMYLDQNNGIVGGFKVDLIIEDEEGNPATALVKARKLVEKDKVDAIVGPLLGSSGYAVAEYCAANQVPLLVAIASGEDLTQRKGSEYIIRTGWTSAQPMHPLADYVYNELGYRKVVEMAYDFAFGHEVIGGFQQAFEDLGGTVVNKIWSPIGTPDFVPYLTQIPSDVDAVVANYSGSDALKFVKQYQDFGLKDKIPLIAGGTTTDEHVLVSMGDEALGIISALHYSAAIDTPKAKEFVAAFKSKYGHVPSYYAEGTYSCMAALAKGLEGAGSIKDVKAFAKVLQENSLTTPRGTWKLDQYNNPVETIYIRKVEKVDGELQNTVIKTYDNVSQFWNYDPKEFLARPVYSRDYPPLKN